MSPQRRTDKPGTTFETIEELCHETGLSEDGSGNSSVDADEPSPDLRAEAEDDDSLASAAGGRASRGTGSPAHAQLPRSGPLALGQLLRRFGGMAETRD